MAGEIMSILAQATTQSGWVDSPVMRSVSESDAARFADLLPARVPSVAAVDRAAMPAQGAGIGDTILRSVDAAGRQYAAQAEQVHALFGVKGSELSVMDLIRVQFQMIDTSLQVDLISKAVSKSTQHVDQLTKLQ